MSSIFRTIFDLIMLDPCTWGITGYSLYRKGYPFLAIPFRQVSLAMGIFLHPNATIGEGFRIPHVGFVVVGSGVSIGKRCTVFQGVTIGAIKSGYPTIGNDVYIGANACLLGSINVGDNVKIGAGAVVLTDVPSGCVAVGNPARIISQ